MTNTQPNLEDNSHLFYSIIDGVTEIDPAGDADQSEDLIYTVSPRHTRINMQLVGGGGGGGGTSGTGIDGGDTTVTVQQRSLGDNQQFVWNTRRGSFPNRNSWCRSDWSY